MVNQAMVTPTATMASTIRLNAQAGMSMASIGALMIAEKLESTMICSSIWVTLSWGVAV